MVKQHTGSGDGKIKRGKRKRCLPLLIPRSLAAEVNDLHGKWRCFFSSSRLLQRKQQAAISRLAGTNRLARQRRAPELRTCRKRNLQKVSLVVANRVASLDQGLALIAHQYAIPCLFYVSEQH